jgi:diaminopimelate epimerase
MKYYLAEACENTFVLFDCLSLPMVDETFLEEAHQCLEEEERDDALILVGGEQIDDTLQARLLVLGLDQELGEFCGNGARACAAYLFERHPLRRRFFLLTEQGKHPLAQHAGGIYSIALPPARFEWNKKFIADPALFEKDERFCYVEMLEPHLILEGEMSDAELLSLGKEINQRKDLFPLGINVNSWHVLSEGTLSVKTYERGVQRLTRSCGTGSMSCAAFYKKEGTVLVSTPGGLLEITLHKNGIQLKGPAQVNL